MLLERVTELDDLSDLSVGTLHFLVRGGARFDPTGIFRIVVLWIIVNDPHVKV